MMPADQTGPAGLTHRQVAEIKRTFNKANKGDVKAHEAWIDNLEMNCLLLIDTAQALEKRLAAARARAEAAEAERDDVTIRWQLLQNETLRLNRELLEARTEVQNLSQGGQVLGVALQKVIRDSGELKADRDQQRRRAEEAEAGHNRLAGQMAELRYEALSGIRDGQAHGFAHWFAALQKIVGMVDAALSADAGREVRDG